MQEVRSVVIPSNYPERTGKHFIRCCNRQTPQSGDISIAGAILQHTGNILELSQERLSAEAHLSGASISRFIRRCGFESFQSFKNQFERFLSQRSLRRSKHFLAAYHDQSDMDVGRQLYDDAVQNLKATMDDLPLPLLEQTARMMCQSRTVYLVGDGRDLYCFYSLQLDLLCSGRAASTMATTRCTFWPSCSAFCFTAPSDIPHYGSLSGAQPPECLYKTKERRTNHGK